MQHFTIAKKLIEISTNVNFLIQRWELDWLMKHNEEKIIEENHLNQFLLSVINSKFYFLFLKQNTFSVLCSLQNDDDMKSNNVEHLWRISIISEIDWEIKGNLLNKTARRNKIVRKSTIFLCFQLSFLIHEGIREKISIMKGK